MIQIDKRFSKKEHLKFCSSSTLFILILVFIISLHDITFIKGIQAYPQNRENEIDPSTPDKCFCYCCPGQTNPYSGSGSTSCNSTNPPLAGTMPIGGGAGDLACNQASCNSWFFTKCPTMDQIGIKAAASIPKCRSCAMLSGNGLSTAFGYENQFGSSSSHNSNKGTISSEESMDKYARSPGNGVVGNGLTSGGNSVFNHSLKTKNSIGEIIITMDKKLFHVMILMMIMIDASIGH